MSGSKGKRHSSDVERATRHVSALLPRVYVSQQHRSMALGLRFWARSSLKEGDT